MQSTGQTGGEQARLTGSGTRLVVTTRDEWGLTERFVSGSAIHVIATRPSVDVQSVPCFSIVVFYVPPGIPFTNEEDMNYL